MLKLWEPLLYRKHVSLAGSQKKVALPGGAPVVHVKPWSMWVLVASEVLIGRGQCCHKVAARGSMWWGKAADVTAEKMLLASHR
jgi:hypothetical protein